jgi:hypothetical protein
MQGLLSLCQYRDILCQLSSIGDLPLPQHSPPASNKRERDSDEPISAQPATAASSPPDGPRAIAGSRRVMSKEASSEVTRQQNMSPTLNLPMYGNELGRLPLHGPFTFSTRVQPGLGSVWLSAHEPVATNPGGLPAYVSGSGEIVGTFSMDQMYDNRMPAGFSESFPSPPETSSSQYHYYREVPDMSTGQAAPDLTSPHGNSYDFPQHALPSGTIAMWSHAPTGFEYVFSFLIIALATCRDTFYQIR